MEELASLLWNMCLVVFPISENAFIGKDWTRIVSDISKCMCSMVRLQVKNSITEYLQCLKSIDNKESVNMRWPLLVSTNYFTHLTWSFLADDCEHNQRGSVRVSIQVRSLWETEELRKRLLHGLIFIQFFIEKNCNFKINKYIWGAEWDLESEASSARSRVSRNPTSTLPRILCTHHTQGEMAQGFIILWYFFTMRLREFSLPIKMVGELLSGNVEY